MKRLIFTALALVTSALCYADDSQSENQADVSKRRQATRSCYKEALDKKLGPRETQLFMKACVAERKR